MTAIAAMVSLICCLFAALFKIIRIVFSLKELPSHLIYLFECSFVERGKLLGLGFAESFESISKV